MSSIRFGKFFGFILVAFFVWLFDTSFCRFSSISSYHTKSLVFTRALLTLETYVKYWEKHLCLHSNQINSSAKCQEDEMNVSENCNCYFSGIFHLRTMNILIHIFFTPFGHNNRFFFQSGCKC